MAITQGDPLPDITKTTTTEQQAPDYYTDYLTDLSKAGETALDLTGAELFEPQTEMQTSGYSKVPTAAAAYSPLMGLAETAGKTFGGIGATDVAAFFDPYQTGVLNELDRLSAQNVQRNLLPGLKAGFVGAGGAGGLGSQRYADALGQSLADVELGLAGQRAGLMSKGYQDAIANAFKQAQEERQAAAAQGDLATLAQELGLTEASALTKFGAEEQALGQAKIDAPLKTAMNVQGLLRGYTVPQTELETYVGPGEQGQYQQSDLANIIGILSLIGAAGGARATPQGGIGGVETAGAGLADAFDFLTEKLPKVDFRNMFGNSSIDGTGIDQNIYDQRITNIV
jgi:hypothetical protein